MRADPDAATTAAPDVAVAAYPTTERHDLGCRCWPHYSQEAIDAAVQRVSALAYADERKATARERQRIRRDLIGGDPGRLEEALREVLDDEEAAECAGIVADLLDGDGDE